MAHVGRGVFLLFRAQGLRTPIGGLLLFGDFDTENLTAQILKTMTVRVGARQARGDFGAVNGRGDDAEILLENRYIEPGEMKDFYAFGIRQQGLQTRRVELPWGELHQMLVALSVRQLHEAQPVAVVVKTHGFGIDGDVAIECHVGR